MRFNSASEFRNDHRPIGLLRPVSRWLEGLDALCNRERIRPQVFSFDDYSTPSYTNRLPCICHHSWAYGSMRSNEEAVKFRLRADSRRLVTSSLLTETPTPVRISWTVCACALPHFTIKTSLAPCCSS